MWSRGRSPGWSSVSGSTLVTLGLSCSGLWHACYFSTDRLTGLESLPSPRCSLLPATSTAAVWGWLIFQGLIVTPLAASVPFLLEWLLTTYLCTWPWCIVLKKEARAPPASSSVGPTDMMEGCWAYSFPTRRVPRSKPGELDIRVYWSVLPCPALLPAVE